MTAYAGTTELLNFIGITVSDYTTVVSDTQLQNALDRATIEIDECTKTHFAAGTIAPDYIAVSNEKQDGKGKYNRDYFTRYYPIPNLLTYVAGTVAVNAGTIPVDSTSGFPTSGVIGIGANKVTYTGKASSGTAFTGCSGVTVELTNDAKVLPYVMEISVDDEGTTPTFVVKSVDSEFDCNTLTGKFHLYKDYTISSIYSTTNPPKYCPNRVNLTYIYGWQPDALGNIPQDIKRLCLMIASRDLMHTLVRKASMLGLNNFNPSMIDVDAALIEETKKRYSNPMFGNT